MKEMIETPERIVFQLLLNAMSNDYAVKEPDEKITKPHKTSEGGKNWFEIQGFFLWDY